MKFCPECDSENQDDAIYCISCGKKLKKDSEAYKAAKEAEHGFVRLWYEQSRIKKVVIAFASIFLIIILLFFINESGVFTNIQHYEDDMVSFNHITGWNIKEANGSLGRIVTGTYDDNGPITLSIVKFSNPVDNLDEFKTSWEEAITSVGGELKSSEQITVDGSTGYAIDSTSPGNETEVNQYSILITKNGVSYVILFSTESNLHSYRRSINTIVNSFHVK